MPGAFGEVTFCLSPSFTPQSQQDLDDFTLLCAAIGRAMGEVAAHETAWEPNNKFRNTGTGGFLYMECTPGNNESSNCPGPGLFYQQETTPTEAYTGTSAIPWGSQAECYIERYLIPGHKCSNQTREF